MPSGRMGSGSLADVAMGEEDMRFARLAGSVRPAEAGPMSPEPSRRCERQSVRDARSVCSKIDTVARCVRVSCSDAIGWSKPYSEILFPLFGGGIGAQLRRNLGWGIASSRSEEPWIERGKRRIGS
jgi:hypothetical protein